MQRSYSVLDNLALINGTVCSNKYSMRLTQLKSSENYNQLTNEQRITQIDALKAEYFYDPEYMEHPRLRNMNLSHIPGTNENARMAASMGIFYGDLPDHWKMPLEQSAAVKYGRRRAKNGADVRRRVHLRQCEVCTMSVLFFCYFHCVFIINW